MRILIFDSTELKGSPRRSRDVTSESLPCSSAEVTDAHLIAVADREHDTYWMVKSRFSGRLGTMSSEYFFETLEAAVKEHVNGQR